MNYFKRITAFAVAILCTFGITVNAGQNLPYINAALQQTVSNDVDAKTAEAQRKLSVRKLAREVTKHPFVDKTSIPQVEERLGLPTFVFVSDDVPVLKVGNLSRDIQSKSEFAAKTYLSQFADLYQLNKQTLSGAKATHVHDVGSGPVIVKFQQYIDGVEVFLHNMQVMMQRNSKLTAISGYLSPHVSQMESGGNDSFELQKKQVLDFQLGADNAIVNAFKNLGGEMNLGDLTYVESKGSYDFYEASGQADSVYALQQQARTKRVLFSLADGLVPGYYVEIKAGPMGDRVNFDYYSFVVSAQSGKVLFRNNLVKDADNDTGVEHTYKVYADADGIPYDSPMGNAGSPYMTRDDNHPDFTTQRNITLEYHSSLSTKDPWLAVDATKTSGNNVNAYADLEADDNYQSGGLDAYAVPSSPLTFDYTYGLPDASGDVTSDTYIQAAVTNLFYNHNFLHDWFYDAGFNEAAGNAQVSNYGRGGVEGDPMLAEAMDYGGTNNANMATPADGTSPQTQMYIWTPNDTTLTFYNSSNDTINDALQRQRAGTSVGNFGPDTYDVSADIVEVLSGNSRSVFCDATADIDNSGDLNGKIALINRGTCGFTTKTYNAQIYGAVGAILVSTVTAPTDAIQALGGEDDSVTIPAMLISNFSGQLYDAEKGNGTLKAHMKVEDTTGRPKRDGTFDNGIIAHEWGHYITNRLIGNGNGMGTPQAGCIGEGAGDFHALHLVTREEDAQITGNDEYQGVYPMGGFALTERTYQAFYFGIRRYPYSTQMSINPLTFRYIDDTNTLPDTPVRSPSSSPNSEVHRCGEVWGTAIWETYANLLASERLSFEKMRDQMKLYLVAGYKMTPNNPTFIEGRDAFLSAVKSYNSADYAIAKEAFRKRGMGALAVAPTRDSTDMAGTVEDFSAAGGNLDFVSGTVDKSEGYCDADGVIDEGEDFTVSVTLRNSGFMTLTNTTATISVDPASDAGVDVTWANGGVVSFADSEPNELVTGTVTGTLNTAGRGNTMLLAINYADDTSTDVTGEAPDPLKEWVHFDQTAPDSSSDNGEQPFTNWTIANLVDGGTSNWTYYQDLNDLPDSAFANISSGDETTLKGYAHGYYAVDFGAASDMTLTSPELTADASGDITMTWDHVYHFEDGSWDGGVLEVSINDGSWTDITTVSGGDVSPDYDGLFVNNVNPMSVVDGSFRGAWLNTSPDFPAMTSATATLTGLTEGDTVQFRFRAGSDGAAADFGWYIDDIEFTGITNIPFSSIADDSGTCTNRPPVSNAGTDQTVASGASVTLTGTVDDLDSGDTLSYQWKQTDGTAVTLTNATSLSASFTAPTVAQDTVLTFAFYASDGTIAGPSDKVNVTVTSTNNPPTVPYLVFPENGSTGVASDLTFKWAKVTDSDANDTVSYTMEYCDNALFVNCRSSGTATSSAAAYHSATYTAGIGGGLAAFFLLSVILVLVYRNKLRGRGMRFIVISLFAIAFTVVMAACSSDKDETETTTVTVTKNEMVTASVTGLTSGYTYYWKVTATDSSGASVDSMVYTFTVE